MLRGEEVAKHLLDWIHKAWSFSVVRLQQYASTDVAHLGAEDGGDLGESAEGAGAAALVQDLDSAGPLFWVQHSQYYHEPVRFDI